MASETDRERIAGEFLGKTGAFHAYFDLYDELFTTGAGGHIVQIEQLQHGNDRSIDHGFILTTAKMLKDDNSLTLNKARESLQSKRPGSSPLAINFAVNLAVQAMLMVDSAVTEYRGPGYTIGKYRPASWLPDESFITFVAGCFPQVSSERRGRVAEALDEKPSLKAWKLKRRFGITFRKTNNLADHLLFDPKNRILYLFHHAAYLKAHLSLWNGESSSKDVEIKTTLKRGTLCPRLLAETLHSLQSILFPNDDDRSMRILKQLIKKDGFDDMCSVHEGYKMFEDSTEDFTYVYWGERLAVLHDLVLNRPPRTGFQRWMRRQSSERNSFMVAMLALIIAIITGLVSLPLSAFQAWVSWQAWKHPVQ